LGVAIAPAGAPKYNFEWKMASSRDEHMYLPEDLEKIFVRIAESDFFHSEATYDAV
jgi:hypothetical protein